MQKRKSPMAQVTPYELFFELAPPGLEGLTRDDPRPGESMEEYAERARGNAVKSRVLFPAVRQTWDAYSKYLTKLLRWIQAVRSRLLLDLTNQFPPPAVEHVYDEEARELVVYLADGGEIRSGRVDPHDPRRGCCGDYIKLLDHEGKEVVVIETADLLADPVQAPARLQDFLIAAAGVRHADHNRPGHGDSPPTV